MKSIIIFLIVLTATFASMGQSITNGLYFKEGKTYEVDKKIHEVKTTTTNTVVVFSNKLKASVEPNSDFMVNSFFQEINTIPTPAKAKFGTHTITTSLNSGEVFVVYQGYDENSACMLSTPKADIQFKNGSFYIVATSTKTFIFVLEGELVYFGGGSMEKTLTAGNAAIATLNEIKILQEKTSFSTQKIKSEAVTDMANLSKARFINSDNIVFVDVYGKVVGIDMN